jgi:eukaryotic-like serine/threonine-protein kinase
LALACGTRLGPYEIVAPIGAGGMGDVYKARDTRLDRVVAIKISKDHFSERFEREARAVAALNHPHVCQLYDIGPNFLVMEFVEGASIHPSDVPQILDQAMQIADGLAAAHAAGIVHRDLKPGNILLTRHGQVKILDFGLATMAPESLEAASAHVTKAVTDAGTTVGTTAYMSPEQARGETVDARTDLWSLGVVLYEMATRVRPFDGATTAVIFEALLNRAPVPVRERNPKIPPELERIIGRLLEKDKALRYQSAADLGADLKRVERDSSAGRVAAVTAPARQRGGLPTYAIAAALVLLAGGAALFYAARPASPVTLPSEYTQLTNFNDSATAPSLSPDGRMVTFIRSGEFCCSGGQGQIYVKLLPNGEAMRLTNDSGPKFGPAFSPDGSRVSYTVPFWDTWTVPVLGGQPSQFLPNAFGLTWIAGQQVLFSEVKAGLHMGIVTATEGRAAPRDIYFPAHERAMAHFSHVSPDRKSVLVVEMDGSGAWQPCRLVPFDAKSTGRQVGPQGKCQAAGWSPDGTWMYFSAQVEGSSHLWRQRFPNGAPEQITFGPTEEEGVAVAPDGRSLVTSVGTSQSAIWMHDARGERAISSEGYASDPHVSRDGTRVFYLLRRDSAAVSAELRSVDLASGKTDHLLPGLMVLDYDISSDGKDVAFTATAGEGTSQIWLAPLDRRSAPREVARGGNSVSFGANDELVFLLKEEKNNYLYRIKRDGSERERITSGPVLGKNGVSPDGEWVIGALPVVGDATAEVPRGVFAIPVHGGVARRICDVDACPATWSPDGRFLFVSSLTVTGKTLVIPVPAGKSLPDFPLSGITLSAAQILPGTHLIDHDWISPGPDSSTYAFAVTSLRRNLFRIPLH